MKSMNFQQQETGIVIPKARITTTSVVPSRNEEVLRFHLGEQSALFCNRYSSTMKLLCGFYGTAPYFIEELSNGGLFMGKRIGGDIAITSPNGYRATVSEEVAGIVVSLFTFSYASFEFKSESIGTLYGHLYAYMSEHSQIAVIARLID